MTTTWTILFVLSLQTGLTEYGQIDNISTSQECETVKTFLSKNMPRWVDGQCIMKTGRR